MTKDEILNKRDLIYYMGSGEDEVEGSKQDVHDAMEEYAKQECMAFVEWITREDSQFGVMYGGTPELEKDYRFAGEETDHTIEEVYQQYLKSKQQP